jgi:SAM-dependent methyltransferase
MNNLYNDIQNYYTNKLNTFGATPQGVDWNSKEGQFLRFEQLSKIITDKQNFSISDLGCGYGEYLNYLQKHYDNFEYFGYDLCKTMIETAKEHHTDTKANFFHIHEMDKLTPADYATASGIFNTKMDYTQEIWLEYILDTLSLLDQKSDRGFSFNMLTSYADMHLMRDDLYYGDPLFFFDYCKKKFSKNIALLHDYNLYEFTILIRKG